MTEEKRYQRIFMTLSDGRKLSAVVPEFCKEGDNLFLHPQFEVTEPTELPDGHYWSRLQEEATNDHK